MSINTCHEDIAAAYHDLVVPAAEATNDWLANLSSAMGTAVVASAGEGIGGHWERGSYYVTHELNGTFEIDFPKSVVKSIRMVQQLDPFTLSAETAPLDTTFTVKHLTTVRGEPHIYDAGVSRLVGTVPESRLLHPLETNKVFAAAGIGSIVPTDHNRRLYKTVEAMTTDNANVFLNRLILGSDLGHMVLGVVAQKGVTSEFDMDPAADQVVELWRAIRPDIVEAVWRPYHLERVAAMA